MAAVDSLRTHLLDELRDLRDAEEQLTTALPRMARAATAAPLRVAFQKHLKETRGQLRRLDEALRDLGEQPESKTCKGMKGLLAEGETVMNKTPEGALRDAVMITSAQKVEHYEIASYGTARTYAQVLGEARVARLLEQTLEEEKAADLTLTEIAEGTVNEDAAEEWQAQSEEGLLATSAKWMGDTARSASRQVSRTVKQAAVSTGIAPDRPAARRRARQTAPKTRSSSRRKTSR